MKLIIILLLAQACQACQLLKNHADFNSDSWGINADSDASISTTPRASLVYSPGEIGEKLILAQGFDCSWQETYPRLIRISATVTDTFSLEIELGGRVFQQELQPGQKVHEFKYKYDMPPNQAQMKLTFVSRNPSSVMHLSQIELRTNGGCYPDNQHYVGFRLLIVLAVLLVGLFVCLVRMCCDLMGCCRKDESSKAQDKPKQQNILAKPKQQNILAKPPLQCTPMYGKRLIITVTDEECQNMKKMNQVGIDYHVCCRLISLPKPLRDHLGFYMDRVFPLENKYEFMFSSEPQHSHRLTVVDVSDVSTKKLRIIFPLYYKRDGKTLSWQKFSSYAKYKDFVKRLEDAVRVFNENLHISDDSIRLGDENLLDQNASYVFGRSTTHFNE